MEAREGSGGTWHKMKLFLRQPWFIGTMGAVAWIILLIVVLLLYRQRRHKKRSKNSLQTRGDLPFPFPFLLLSHVPHITKLHVMLVTTFTARALSVSVVQRPTGVFKFICHSYREESKEKIPSSFCH